MTTNAERARLFRAKKYNDGRSVEGSAPGLSTILKVPYRYTIRIEKLKVHSRYPASNPSGEFIILQDGDNVGSRINCVMNPGESVKIFDLSTTPLQTNFNSNSVSWLTVLSNGWVNIAGVQISWVFTIIDIGARNSIQTGNSIMVDSMTVEGAIVGIGDLYEADYAELGAINLTNISVNCRANVSAPVNFEFRNQSGGLGDSDSLTIVQNDHLGWATAGIVVPAGNKLYIRASGGALSDCTDSTFRWEYSIPSLEVQNTFDYANTDFWGDHIEGAGLTTFERQIPPFSRDVQFRMFSVHSRTTVVDSVTVVFSYGDFSTRVVLSGVRENYSLSGFTLPSGNRLTVRLEGVAPEEAVAIDFGFEIAFINNSIIENTTIVPVSCSSGCDDGCSDKAKVLVAIFELPWSIDQSRATATVTPSPDGSLRVAINKEVV